MQGGPPPGGYQYPPSQQPPSQQQYHDPFQSPPQQVYGYQQYAATGPAPKDPTTGLLLELIGLFGFSGIGWIWAGETAIGVGLLLGFWAFLAIEVVLMFVVIGFCLLPLNLVIPIASGIFLQKRLKERQALLAAQHYPQQTPGRQFPY